jgi:hypothetical protein
MKLSAVGPKAFDHVVAAGRGMGRRARSLLVTIDDILKTLVDAAFFLTVEMQRAKAEPAREARPKLRA